MGEKIQLSKMEMKRIIEIIKTEVAECEKTGNMFQLPELNIDGVKVIHESLKGNGSTLYHDTYHIELHDGAFIDIDYQSKDKCRSYSVRPDRSYIVVKCSNPSFGFSDAWDENS